MGGSSGGGGRQQFVEAYVSALQRRRYVALVLTVVVVAVGAVFAPRFVNATNQNFEPPKNSKAQLARDQMYAAFPDLKHISSVVLYIERPGRDLLTEDLKRFTFLLNETVSSDPRWPPMYSYSGYFVMESIQRRSGDSFVHRDPKTGMAQSTFIAIQMLADPTSDTAADCAKWLKNTAVPAAQAATNTTSFEMTLMGTSAFLQTMIDASTQDLETVDSIVLPLALLILAYILRSARLILITVTCLGAALATAFALMYVVCLGFDVFSAAPSLMMSIAIAMSVDYSLFLLSRYKDELRHQASTGVSFDTPAAVVIMLCTAGHTVAVSGVTLTFCFLGLLFFKMNVLQSFGIGCSLMLAMALLYNLILVPLLLLSFPKFFEGCAKPDFQFLSKCLDKDTSKQLPNTGGTDSDGDDPTIQDGEAINLLETEAACAMNATKNSVWYRLGAVITSFPYNIVIVLLVAAATMPFDYYAFSYETTDENLFYLPKHSQVTTAYERMGASFGYGTVFPYQILMVPRNRSAKILDESNDYELWMSTRKAIQGLVNMSKENTFLKDFTGPSMSEVPIDPWMMQECLSIVGTEKNYTCSDFVQMPDKACRGNVLLACEFMNNKEDPALSTAMWVSYTPEFPPMGKEGKAWLKSARNFADKFAASNPAKHVELYFVGEAPDSIDGMNQVDSDFPTMIGITTALVLVLVGLSFKSVVIPIRSVFTIALTIMWVYGFAAITYQHGGLEWTSFSGFDNTHAIVYIIPLMSFSIVVGISLDYDIFLLSRIVEYRRLGCSTNEAIRQGLAKTGYIITAAGIIMATAFSGLLFSSEPFMHQLSFYMVFSVLFDTFIVRSLLVPALMSTLGEWNWWPMAYPINDTTNPASANAQDDWPQRT